MSSCQVKQTQLIPLLDNIDATPDAATLYQSKENCECDEVTTFIHKDKADKDSQS